MKKNLKAVLEKSYDWWNPYLRHNLKEFEYNSRKIEESGKILEKDLWVRAHLKETPLNNLKERLLLLNKMAWMR